MSATVLLARHASHAEVGHILSGRSDIALNDEGRLEAGRLAERLAAVPLVSVFSSPCRRARETAQPVAARHALPVECVDALDEIDFGRWAGQPFTTLAADPAWERWNAERATATTAGGEDMAGATARAVHHIEAVAGERPVLCVSHCDIIRGVVAHYLGLDANRLLAFDVDPASLTTLMLHGSGARIVALNERST